MLTEIIISILSLIGTLIGTLGGILVSNKLTNYRIQQLEAQVEKHNTVIERVYELEKHNAVQDEDLLNINKRIGALEKK